MRTDKRFDYSHADLEHQWERLHAGDREPFPAAPALEAAWRAFHRGAFAVAMRAGAKLGAAGVLVSNKAAALHTSYVEKSEARRKSLLLAAVERGDVAVREMPRRANAHYALALALGRYSQRISVLEAVAAGHASKIREHLERTIELEPRHAEAHLALGLYHAELVKTLGSIAARLTYGASEANAIEHFRRALQLAPKSVVPYVEYAHGLHLLGADAHRDKLEELRERAGKLRPMDRMEELDLERMLATKSRADRAEPAA